MTRVAVNIILCARLKNGPTGEPGLRYFSPEDRQMWKMRKKILQDERISVKIGSLLKRSSLTSMQDRKGGLSSGTFTVLYFANFPKGEG
jgi:hypothetical protein